MSIISCLKLKKGQTANISVLYGGTLNFRDRFGITTPCYTLIIPNKLTVNDSYSSSSEYTNSTKKLFFLISRKILQRNTPSPFYQGALLRFFTKKIKWHFGSIKWIQKKHCRIRESKSDATKPEKFSCYCRIDKGDLIASEYPTTILRLT
jgi:hypothetical protein